MPKYSFSSAKVRGWHPSLRSRPGKPLKPSITDSDLSESLESNNVTSTRYDHYLNIDGENHSMILTTAVGGRDHDQHSEAPEKDSPKAGITVRKDVEVFV